MFFMDSWLNTIVDCVHEDCRDERKLKRYQKMIHDWAESLVSSDRPSTISRRDELKRDNPDWSDERIKKEIEFESQLIGKDVSTFNSVLTDPLVITTHVATPLNKIYATLAAIHDESKHCGFPINPWHGQSRGYLDLHQHKLLLVYLSLRSCISRITNDDKEGMNRMLHDVAVDLKLHCEEEEAVRVSKEEQLQAHHSDDYTSVNWFGITYHFNKTQAECIKFLWIEWEKGGLGLSEKTIAEKIESADNRYRLANTFRKKNKSQHPAWGTMIQSAGKGIFRLVGPNNHL